MKTAFVSGAASGIGKATALGLSLEGFAVGLADIDADGGNATARQIIAAGGSAAFFAADMTDGTHVRRAIEGTASRFGSLDCAVNNAGREAPLATTIDTLEEDWDQAIATNLKSVFLCLQHELRLMREGGGGAIVNMSSIGGVTAVPGNIAYCAAKHGVIGITRTAADEFGSAGIRVNAICPGLTESRIVDRTLAILPAALNTFNPPLGRIARASEIADVAVWLCSDRSSYVTGQHIVVDGGWTACATTLISNPDVAPVVRRTA